MTDREELIDRLSNSVMPVIDKLLEDNRALATHVIRLRAESERRLGELLFWEFEYREAMDNYKGEATHAKKLRAELEQARAELRKAEDLAILADSCDAEGCTLPHTPGCETAAKYAAEHDGCTCGRPWEGTPQPHAMYCALVHGGSDRYRQAVAAQARREIAADIRAHCLTHNPDVEHGWITCHCDVADDLSRTAPTCSCAAEAVHQHGCPQH